MPNQITMRMVVHFNVKLVWTLYFCVSFCNNLHTYTPSSNLLPHALVCRFGWALFNGWSLIQLNTSSTSFSKAKWDVTLFTWVQSPPFYLVHVHLQGSLCMVAKKFEHFLRMFLDLQKIMLGKTVNGKFISLQSNNKIIANLTMCVLNVCTHISIVLSLPTKDRWGREHSHITISALNIHHLLFHVSRNFIII